MNPLEFLRENGLLLLEGLALGWLKTFPASDQASFSKRYRVNKVQTSHLFRKLEAANLIQCNGLDRRGRVSVSWKFYSLTSKGESLATNFPDATNHPS